MNAHITKIRGPWVKRAHYRAISTIEKKLVFIEKDLYVLYIFKDTYAVNI